MKNKVTVPETGGQTMEELALSDVLEVFTSKKASKLRTKKILVSLWEDTEKPWATYSPGGGRIGARHLSTLLKYYGIKSRNIRFTRGVFKGYRKKWLESAMLRTEAIKSLN